MQGKQLAFCNRVILYKNKRNDYSSNSSPYGSPKSILECCHCCCCCCHSQPLTLKRYLTLVEDNAVVRHALVERIMLDQAMLPLYIIRQDSNSREVSSKALQIVLQIWFWFWEKSHVCEALLFYTASNAWLPSTQHPHLSHVTLEAKREEDKKHHN